MRVDLSSPKARTGVQLVMVHQFHTPSTGMALLVTGLMLIVPYVSAICPNDCFCDDISRVSQCVGAQLDVVPILLNPAIHQLDLRFNRIPSIEQSFNFYSELEVVDLSYNAILNLGVKQFVEQRHLAYLNVSNNKITTVSTDAFHGLQSLLTLDLSHNFIEMLTENAMNGVSSLQELILSHNRITFLSEKAFASLTKLHLLKLDFNFFDELPTRSFYYLTNLITLFLNNNLLTRIGDVAFSPLANLKQLDLQKNEISAISLLGFYGLGNLERLDLHANLLNVVPTVQLSKLPRLQELNLAENRFRVIRSYALQNLFSLERLNISGTVPLHDVQPHAFIDNVKLKELVFDWNPSLEAIPAHLFEANPSLERVSFRGNGFVSITQQHFPLSQLYYLDLRDNPLSCNCSLLWLWKYYHKRNSSLQLTAVTCHSPPELRHRALRDLAPADLQCFNPWFLIAVTTGVCVTTFILSAIVGLCVCVHRKRVNSVINDRYSTKTIATWKDTNYYNTAPEQEYTYRSCSNGKAASGELV